MLEQTQMAQTKKQGQVQSLEENSRDFKRIFNVLRDQEPLVFSLEKPLKLKPKCSRHY